MTAIGGLSSNEMALSRLFRIFFEWFFECELVRMNNQCIRTYIYE